MPEGSADGTERSPYQCSNCGNEIDLATGECDKCFLATEAERRKRAVEGDNVW